MRIAVGIITMGRAGVLAETLRELHRQTLVPAAVLVCATSRDDVGALADGVTLILAAPGTSAQRNRLIDAAAGCDLLLFLDDDFLPEPGYLAATAAAFMADPTLVVSTGVVLADGVKGPGIGVAAGRALLAAAPAVGDPTPLPCYNGYGCNMAVRMDRVRRSGVRFDEAMPFYAWYEDLDFTRRLALGGRICRLPAARGVHLGTKAGRGSGVRLGYAQVVNPVHIARKGAYHWNRALRSMARHMLMNCLRAAWPEPWIDRWGRLRGNLLGLSDLMHGRVDPGRAGRL